MRNILNFILKLSLLFSVLVAAFLYAAAVNAVFGIVSINLVELTGINYFIGIFYFSYFAVFFSVLGVFRALLRVNPTQMGVDSSVKKLNDFIFFIWILFISSVVFILSIVAPVFAFLEKRGLSFAELSFSSLSVADTLYFVLFFAVPVLAVVLMVKFIKLRASLFKHKNSVLFLRRFGSSGEFELLPLIIRSISKAQRIFMLIEQKALLKAWDFNTICFTPFISTRLDRVCYLSGRDDEWEQNVALLILKSKYVVMDISDISSSIHTEINLLNTFNAFDKTIWITPLPTQSFKSAMSVFNREIQDDRVISTHAATRSSSFWRIFLYFGAYFYPMMIPLAIFNNSGVESNFGTWFMLFWLVVSIYLGVKNGGRPRLSGKTKKLMNQRLKELLGN